MPETETSKQTWDRKTIELNGSILQSWGWGEFLVAQGKKIHRLSGGNFQALLAETDLPTGKKYLYCPRGPLGEWKEAVSRIHELAWSLPNCVFARIEPLAVPEGLVKAEKDIQPKHNWVLELGGTEEQLLSEMKPKHRYNLNLASRKGVTVREGGKEDLIAIYQLLLETAGRNRFRLHPQDYYWQLFDRLHPEHLKLLLAEYQGKIVGGMLLSLFGGTAVYLHGGSSQNHREVMAPYLLHWEAIRLCQKLGFKEYDFGGVAPEDEPAHPWAGISRFKKGFGGKEVVYPGSYDLVVSPVWYNVYKLAKKFRSLIR